MRGDLAEAIAAVNDARARRDAVLEKVRQECPHENVIERPYQPSRWSLNHTPPRRLCVDCGIVEEGWGTGFHVLGEPKETVHPSAFLTAFPAPCREVSWCYGDRDHPPHSVYVDHLTKGDGTRCKDYTGPFE